MTANVAPKLMSEHMASCLAGDFAAAAKQHRHLQKLNGAMFIETNPIPVKTALALMGMVREEFKLPLCPMSEGPRKKLEDTLKKYGCV